MIELHTYLPFICAVGLLVIGQNVIAEQQVAQDISAEIEAADLEYATQLVNDCVPREPVGQISDYGANLWEGRQSLVIEYDLHENTTTRKARYGAEFDRETSNDQWTLFEIGYSGEQTLAGQGEPIHFNGYLDRETLEELTAHIADMWVASTSAPFAISGVVTNRVPPTNCGAGVPESGDMEIVYEVSIRNLFPRNLPAPEPPPNSLIIGSSGFSDHSYKVRVAQADSRGFLTTDVACESGASCDPELLERLRADLDRPIDSTEIEQRLQDAVAALPASLRGAQVRSTQSMLSGTFEMFHVSFAETAVSQSRTEQANVMCSRRAGTRDHWNCHHSIDGIRQQVPGQAQPINLGWTTFSESEAVQLASALRTQLAAHPDVSATASDIQIFRIGPKDEKLHCLFLRGRDLWEAVFTYDGQVRLESVELRHRMPEDDGLSGS